MAYEIETDLNKIKKMYDKLTYFDQYGGSLVLFIIITLIIIILITYFHTMINVQPIINDWPNQRCNPAYVPFAGFITHPEGVSAIDYTAENFTYCTQNILSTVTGYALQPLTSITNSLQSVSNNVNDSIQSTRGMFDKVRTSMQSVTEEIMGRLMNVMIPLMQIIISFKDLVSKIQGSMTAGLFTLLGSYYTFRSLMGVIAQFIISILVALAVMIAMFWVVPFTWGAAIANTSIFVALSIPMAVILAFMNDVLKVNGDYSIPKLRCFSANTLIPLNNGHKIYIKDINVGDRLANGSYVTAKIKVTGKNLKMYSLNNVEVSENHLIKKNGKWIRVGQHPDAKELNWNADYLYCLNTSNKLIEISGLTFSDWDEITDDNIDILIKKNDFIKNLENIHEYLDDGFEENTSIKLHKYNKSINKVEIGDILENGSIVYGLVEIETNNLRKYKEVHIPNKLYHLLTTDGSLKINSIDVKDYNNLIDKFII